VGEFIARVYDVYFPNNLAHYGGTDADQVPVIPNNDLSTETSQMDESSLQSTTPSDQEMTSEQDLRPES